MQLDFIRAIPRAAEVSEVQPSVGRRRSDAHSGIRRYVLEGFPGAFQTGNYYISTDIGGVGDLH